jgi:hypothetical protein
MFVQAAITVPDRISEFKEWLLGGATELTAATRQRIEAIEVQHYEFLGVLRSQDIAGAVAMRPWHANQVMQAAKDRFEAAKVEAFKTWLAEQKASPMVMDAIKAQDAQYAQSVVHLCPICGQPAVSQDYTLAFGMAKSLACACANGHNWSVLW